MALSNLFGWGKKAETAPAAACGSACGASDKPDLFLSSFRYSLPAGLQWKCHILRSR